LLKGDVKAALAGGEKSAVEVVMATHAGMTTAEFEKIVKDWIATARHPETKRLYTEMVYKPMLELLAFLRAHDFKTFIVSGGGIEFMRPWAGTKKALNEARAKGWTVVDMKRAWKVVFPTL
jgi:phosphoserine phosphatase